MPGTGLRTPLAVLGIGRARRIESSFLFGGLLADARRLLVLSRRVAHRLHP